jgi:DNA-binding response OmpR family regulator
VTDEAMSEPPRLLVVEDEEALAFVLRRIAQRVGWRVETAATVAAFRACFRAARPDLIMLDLRIGLEDGVAELRFLQAEGYRGAVVLMSGDVDSVLQEARALGRSLDLVIGGTLSKPATNAEVTALLETLIRSCGGRSPAP